MGLVLSLDQDALERGRETRKQRAVEVWARNPDQDINRLHAAVFRELISKSAGV